MNQDLLLGLGMGVGLAAACGFRVFVPLLVLSVAARGGAVPVAENLQWVTSDAAVLTLAVATALEIGAYYVPWVDNLLDSIATPAAVLAGAVATAATLSGADPVLQWGLGIIAGGGAAAGVQLMTVATRATSSLTTGGLANPAVSTVEAGAATGLALLAVAVPLVALGLLVVLLVWLVRRTLRRRTKTTWEG